MYTRIIYAILAVTAAAILAGCSPISEPWDRTGYFEKDRTQSEALKEQLRHRAAHTQHGV